MPFAQRNLHYLRASPHVVLQTILYLDPADLRWMNSRLNGNDDDDDIDLTRDDGRYEGRRYDDEQAVITGDEVWNRALNHLKEEIMPKLRREAEVGGNLSSTGSAAVVSLHIDVEFQMAYFFRPTTGKHAVLLKNKELVFPRKVEMPPPAFPASALNRPAALAPQQQPLPPSRLAARQAQEDERLVNATFDGSTSIAADNLDAAQRKRPRSPIDVSLEDVHVKDEEDDAAPPALLTEDEGPDTGAQESAIDVDQLQDDKKPRLYVSYSGFQIFGKSLVVVIEPTRRTRTLRKGLFRAKTDAERHQLSAIPISAEERAGSAVPAARASERAPSRRAASTRGASVASTVGDGLDDDEMPDAAAYDRADSRRQESRSSSRLFRGTPSDWEPTPSPAPPDRRRLFGSGAAALSGENSNDAADPALCEEEAASMALATQMMDRVGSTYAGDDHDDD